jgi:hypothetical protein
MTSPNNLDLRQYAPATQRNRQPILDILKQILPSTGNILEIASGTGEHAVFFAPYFYPRKWIPSDVNNESIESIKSWQKYCVTNNMQSPLWLDVTAENWVFPEDLKPITSVININIIHISPWQSCIGLMRGSQKILSSGSILYLYGPFKINNQHTAPSNEQFDQYLKIQNPQWGVRNLDDVILLANQYKLKFKEIIPMPANNFSVIFERC